MNLKPFVNNRDMWDDFLEELDHRIQDCHRKLEQVTNPVEIHQTQGEIFALRKLKKLRDQVNAG
jgi:TATA-binding protein-associated factor Taf7